MKYVIMLGDGMADYPIAELGGMTPLEYAKTPNMDEIAARGTIGLVDTIPEGIPPASDVANLAILGYDAGQTYTGRGPLEAASLGIDLAADDVAFRCNLVTLEQNNGWRMRDYTAGQISSAEATEIITDLNSALGTSSVYFCPGVSFRHLMVWKNGKAGMSTTPPHDITNRVITDSLPWGEGADFINQLMLSSQEYLLSHPVNLSRVSEGKKPASSIWLWGQGKKPQMNKITDQYQLAGAMISAVDLLHGIGRYAGLTSIKVPGATGYIDTDYLAKAQYAIRALSEVDFVFVHVEAPDAMGHEGNLQGKIQAIEDFDAKVVGPILKAMPQYGEYRIMVASDHPTPISLMTHTSDPSPFAILSHLEAENQGRNFCFGESSAKKSGVEISPGFKLFNLFIKGWPALIRLESAKII